MPVVAGGWTAASAGVFGRRCWTLVGRGLVQRTSSLLLQSYLAYIATTPPPGRIRRVRTTQTQTITAAPAAPEFADPTN